jgi:anaerobic magnesium-protoporphyrin IX monomethyl ester cyclase
MKIFLIAPPWLDIYGNYQAAAKIGCVAPPLGLAYLGSAVRTLGSQCEIIDMEMEGLSVSDLLVRIKQNNPDLVGITATSPVFRNASFIASAIKDQHPKLPIGIGGVHSTVVGRQVLEECEHFDFQVVGEGEFSLQEIIKSLENGTGDLKDIDGVFYRSDGKIIENPRRPLVTNLDNIPIPSRDLLRTEFYHHTVPGKANAPYANIFTSRGCPFQCVFCSQHTMYGRQVRFHSIPRVIEELKQIVLDLGVKHVIFMDETLTLNRAHLFGICKAIKEAELEFTWEGWTHASTITEEILHTMKEAGLIRLSFGIESGDPQILKEIKKGVTLEQIRTAYKLTTAAGIETRGSAMLGHPNETVRTAWNTVKFCRSIKECKQVFLNIVCPYPGTELYDIAVNNRCGMRLLSTDYSKYKRYGDPVISVNDLTPRKLKLLQTVGLLYFYLTPNRIWHNLVKRAGLKAGLINAFAFLKGILNSLFERDKRK